MFLKRGGCSFSFFPLLLSFSFSYFCSIDGVPKEGLRIPDVLVRIAVLHLIREKVCFDLSPNKMLYRVSCCHHMGQKANLLL